MTEPAIRNAALDALDPVRCLCGAATYHADTSELRGRRGEHADGSPCPFVPCDSEDCRALVSPGMGADLERNLDQIRDAYEHWKSHRHLRGCSHGQ